MNDLYIAIGLAVALSLLICTIEIKSQSKKATFRNCSTGSFWMYLLILAIGNTATTLLVAATSAEYFASVPIPQASVVAKTEPSTQPAATQVVGAEPSDATRARAARLLARLPWFWYAFLGVFGFEVLLQNINITFLNRGLLSISDWISKARESAVADALESQIASGNLEAQILADRLRHLPPAELNAYVTNLLGSQRLNELNTSAQQNGADVGLIMALALAYEAADRAKSIKPNV